jgi:hypothetical protein
LAFEIGPNVINEVEVGEYKRALEFLESGVVHYDDATDLELWQQPQYNSVRSDTNAFQCGSFWRLET